MTTVASTLKIFDSMTGPIKNITNGMNMMISTMQKMQSVTDNNVNFDKTLMAAKKQIAQAEIEINKAIDQSTQSQNRMNHSMREGHKHASGMVGRIKEVAAGMLAAQVVMSGVNAIGNSIRAIDDYTSTLARLNLINDHLQTTKELQKDIFDAAQLSRGSYIDMANAIGKMGILASDAFKNNRELVAFTELMQKSFKVGGASTMEQQAGIYQLTQAMAAGKLQGDEFRSIMENAPMLAQAIADFTGKTKGQLKEMSADGTITANIIKGAMFAAADDINKKFAQMPMTFGDYFNRIKNSALRSFSPLIERVNSFLNSKAGAQFIQSIETGIAVLAKVVNVLINGFVLLNQIIQYNWPIISGIFAGLLTYLTIMAVQQIPALIAKLWLTVPPILAQAAAWMMANWPIMLVVIAVALLVAALVHFGVSAQEAVGFVIGLFYSLYAVVYNQFALLWNLIASYAEFFINVFIDPVYAVKKLFYDLATTFGGYMYNMARSAEDFAGNFMKTILKAINKTLEGFNWLVDKVNDMFGTDFGKAALFDENNIHAVSDSMKKIMDTLEKPVSTKNVVSIDRMQQKNLKDSFDIGYKAGFNVTDKALGKLNSAFKGIGANGNGFSNLADGISNIDKVGEVGKIRDTVDISSEDLKLMRELAEMKSIQNFVTYTPTVSVTTGPISKDVDIDEVVARIEQTLEEDLAANAAGVYG